ncbi:MAG: hypothetical protein CL840_20310 [Crocinitomicaceae bacterium]|nr:hypothetical protein [Crocinitomicaceae bacterium]|tara:strand:- start:7337 stop:8290 length:954 start_codon:yes stop_codon:yes gene_type:complete
MKRFTPLVLVLLLATSLMAQQRFPNHLFDHWDKTNEKTLGGITFPEYEEPAPDHFFTTSNPGTHTIKFTPTVMKTTDAYEGKYACLMRSTKFVFGIASGSLMSGTYKGGTDPSKAVHLGQPWTGRPERFVGFYKYIPVDNDYCQVYAMFFKSIGGKRDTVGMAAFTPAMSKATVTSYTKFDIPVTYRNNNDPDSAVIVFSASADGLNFNGGDGTELYVDRILLLYPGETSVNNTEKESAHFWVYPNPTSDVINFTIDKAFTDNTVLSIYNSQGQVVKQEHIEKEFNSYNIQELTNGYYTYQLKDQNQVLTEGKFLKN